MSVVEFVKDNSIQSFLTIGAIATGLFGLPDCKRKFWYWLLFGFAVLSPIAGLVEKWQEQERDEKEQVQRDRIEKCQAEMAEKVDASYQDLGWIKRHIMSSPANAVVAVGESGVQDDRTIKDIVYPAFLKSHAQQVLKEYAAGNYDTAVRLARECEPLINEAVSKVGPVYRQDGGFVVIKHNTYSTLGDEEYFRGNFSRAAEYWDKMLGDFKDVAPYEQANRDAARLRAKGLRLKFFSPDEIAEIRSWGKDKRSGYLGALAELGVLQPIELDYASSSYHAIDYRKVFDLDSDVLYMPAICEEIKDVEGGTSRSNFLILQRSGRDKMELVDLDDAVDLSLGGKNLRRMTPSIIIKPKPEVVKALANRKDGEALPKLAFSLQKNNDQVVDAYHSTNGELRVVLAIRTLTDYAEFQRGTSMCK